MLNVWIEPLVASREHLTICKDTSNNVQTEIRIFLKACLFTSNISIKEYYDFISILFCMINESAGCVWNNVINREKRHKLQIQCL